MRPMTIKGILWTAWTSQEVGSSLGLGPVEEKLETVSALNITPDPSGISYFNENMFIEVMRNGGFKNRPLSNIMPWTFFRNLSDEDLKAMFAYLKTLKPVCHHVDNTETATFCKVCKTKHGLGEMNEVIAIK